MKKRWLLMIILMLAAWMSVLPQNSLKQTVRGTVVDEETGYPLIGATITLLGSSPLKGTVTDTNGLFILTDVPLGRQSFEVSFLGYQKKILSNLMVIGGKELVLSVSLSENVSQVNEVVVKAQHRKDLTGNEMALVSARTFSVEETERFAGSLGDPARMVANYAGVMTQNDTRNDIIIRGNSPTGVIWRLEGIEIANPNHFAANGTTGGPVSMINNNLLANSDFLTGAFPAQYGNGIAGAFDLKLRSGNNQKREYVGQVGFNGFEFGAEGPIIRKDNGVNPSYVANFRYSTLEVMDKLGFDVGTGSAVPEYKDLTFLIDVPGTKAGRFKLFGLMGNSNIRLGRDYADTTGSSYAGRGTAIDFGSALAVIGLTHTYFINEDEKLNSAISYQYTNASTVFDSIRSGGDIILPYYRGDQDETKLSFSSRFSKKFNVRNNVDVGVIIDQFHVKYIDSLRNDDANRLITLSDFSGNLTLLRLYGEWNHKFGARLTGYAGVNNQF